MYYTHNLQINSPRDFAATIDISLNELEDIASRVPQMYSCYPKRRNGKTRIITRPAGLLKHIQLCILNKILRSVTLPEYIQGGVAGRSYQQNARIHTSACVVINNDISDFFPSVHQQYIYAVWENLFGFDEDLSLMATQLCTYRGGLPQGAPTSSHLSNLIFFAYEPTLYETFQANGFRYSRYIDDITVSKITRLLPGDEEFVTNTIDTLLGKYSLKANLAKREKMWKSERMKVNGLNVNGHVPTSPKANRKLLRSEVYELVLASQKADRIDAESLIVKLASVKGKLAAIRPLHQRFVDNSFAQLKPAQIALNKILAD